MPTKSNHNLSNKIAVISDVHGNYSGLKAAWLKIRSTGVRKIVFLGDVLTYGCTPNEVIELLLEIQKEVSCLFVKGNHDQFYFDLDDGKEPFSYKIPDFVKESVYWTHDQLEYKLESIFHWVDSCTINNCYFAHANPYEYGNWTYLNTVQQHNDAGKALALLGVRAGFFGHTHRKKIALYNKCRDEVAFYNEFGQALLVAGEDDLVIVNPGSVGQPRGEGASMCIIEKVGESIEIDMIELNVDFCEEIRKIEMSILTRVTKDKLISYISKVN